MVLERMLEKIGESIDKAVDDISNNISKKISKTKEDIKSKFDKSREDISDEFVKKMNKFGEKVSIENKNLSNFERGMANVAIGVASSIENGYKKITDKLFIKNTKTKYGVLGKLWSKKHVPRERGYACLNYVKVAEKEIPSQNKLKKGILKDIVESLSSSGTELYSLYVYGHLVGRTPTKNHDKRKELIKKYLMSPERRKYYEK